MFRQGMGAVDACAHMIGSVLKVRVVSVNLEKNSMVLSLRLSTVGLTAEQPAELPSLGSVVSGIVASVSPSSVANEAYAVIRLAGAPGAPACHGKLPLQLCGDSVESARAAFDALKVAKKLP